MRNSSSLENVWVAFDVTVSSIDNQLIRQAKETTKRSAKIIVINTSRFNDFIIIIIIIIIISSRSNSYSSRSSSGRVLS